MFLRFSDRPSDSPYIERVWRGRSDGGGPFVSVAAGHLELVVTRLADLTMVTMRGPETRATTIDCPPDGSDPPYDPPPIPGMVGPSLLGVTPTTFELPATGGLQAIGGGIDAGGGDGMFDSGSLLVSPNR